MKIRAESTDVITTVDGRKARVWKATTEDGVGIFLFVALVAASAHADQAQFERELQQMPAPREASLREVLDPRFIW